VRGIKINIKGPRHFTASQLLAVWFDLRNTAARLGHSGAGQRHCATMPTPSLRSTGEPAPTPEQLTARPTS
jgi:hypothetical protein